MPMLDAFPGVAQGQAVAGRYRTIPLNPHGKGRTNCPPLACRRTMKAKPRGNILVVNGYEASRNLYRLVLERNGYHVVTAMEGDSAIRQVAHAPVASGRTAVDDLGCTGVEQAPQLHSRIARGQPHERDQSCRKRGAPHRFPLTPASRAALKLLPRLLPASIIARRDVLEPPSPRPPRAAARPTRAGPRVSSSADWRARSRSWVWVAPRRTFHARSRALRPRPCGGALMRALTVRGPRCRRGERAVRPPTGPLPRLRSSTDGRAPAAAIFVDWCMVLAHAHLPDRFTCTPV